MKDFEKEISIGKRNLLLRSLWFYALFLCVSIFIPSFADNYPSLKVRGENYGIEVLKEGAQPFFNRTVTFGKIAEGHEGWNFVKINAYSTWMPGPLAKIEVMSERSGYLMVMVATGEKPDVCAKWAEDNGWELVPGKEIEYTPGGPTCTLTFYRKSIVANEWVDVVQPQTFSGAIVIAPTIWEYSPEITNLDLFEQACAKVDEKMLALEDYVGLQSEIGDFLMAITDKVSGLEDPNDPLYIDAIEEIDSYLVELDLILNKVDNMYNLFDECTALFESPTLYPGFQNLEKAYEFADGIYTSEYSNSDELLQAYDSLKTAIRNYYDSQIPFATEETPADFTYYVKAPSFRVPYAYTPGCALSSEGWTSVNTGLPSEGNCFYPVHKPASEVGMDISCYNSWTWQFSHMNLYQDVEDLPDGWYQVECLGYTGAGEVYKQHAYAISMADSVLSNFASDAMSGAWETFRTPSIPVYNGNLRIGFESEASPQGGAIGWFLVTDFRLHYCGPLDENSLKPILDGIVAEGKAIADTMKFALDRMNLTDTIAKYENASGVDNIKYAIEAMKEAVATAKLSADEQVEIMNGVLKDLSDSLSAEAYTGDYAVMVSGFCECMNNEINADDATYTEMDSIERILYALRDRYIPSLMDARSFVVNDALAKGVLNENIDRQVAHFTSLKELPLEMIVDKYVKELETAMAQCRATDLMLEGGTDYTSLIVNPTIENTSTATMPDGWTGIAVGGGGRYTSSGQQVDGDPTGFYLDSWNATPGALLYNVHQTISTLPNGKYRLTAMTRTSSEEGVYLYAFADDDSSTVTLSHVELEKINITELGGPSASDGSDSIAAVTDKFGSIFAEVYKRTNGGQTATDAENDTLMANNGWGSGWHYTSLDIEVKNHVLTLGITCDSTFTQMYGGLPFNGTWLSADNFRLTQIEAGDNEGWNPAAGIDGVDDNSNIYVKVENGRIIVPKGALIYSISGLLVDSDLSLPAGIYIVKYGKVAVKVMVN